MKLTAAITALFAAQATAFTFVRPSVTPSYSTKLNENRINEVVDMESPKVVTMETITEPTKKVYCRCWKSGTFPLCDGAHQKHNEKTGDNVGPLIVMVKDEK
mmetsp:Transcript_28194/g.43389  ORF Transcript_28194/g.43389 Transcript_28194/m.43389 type:complete len:102 (+) Transcript_28194:62-367(+)